MSSLRRPRASHHPGTSPLAACLVALALTTGPAFTAAAQGNAKPTSKAAAKAAAKSPVKPPPFDFAVLGNTPFGNSEVPLARSVLANIGDTQAAFVVHVGNLKDVSESCRDELITQRLSLLASSPKPLIYVPGANDWANCQRANEGNYNPVERLDFLRDHAFDDDALLGPGPVGFAQFDLTRQSEMARFRQYRENVRWFYRGVVFVGLNLPGNNNNYRSAGGRNGEYEDRVIATRVWLQHAVVYAQQKNAIGMVIIAQADPEFEPARSGGLGGIFSERAGRRGVDGYKDFRTQLQRLASRFKGPILLIDSGETMRHTQPLRDAHGAPIRTFTQLSSYGSPTANRWVRVRVDPRTPQLFRFESVGLPANGAAAPSAQRSHGAAPSMAVTPSPEPGKSPAGGASAAGAVPYAAPYSTLYPASSLGTGANAASSVSSDPNQGVMPIGPARPANATAPPSAHSR